MNAVLSINRFNEQGQISLRSERFYQESGQWFFSIRSDLDLGPFPTFDEARLALTVYIKESLPEPK